MTDYQAYEFLDGEGDEWLERNRNKLTIENDPVLNILDELPLEPKGKCLEIGCSNGWRLKEINKRYGMFTYGVDPSSKAIDEASLCKEITRAYVGFAHSMAALRNNYFDVVIYGFCLYLCDRADIFMTITEGDRVLKDGGLMIIHDFNSNPCKTPYKHRKGVWSYKQNYSKMFLASPSYRLIASTFNTSNEGIRTNTVALRKDVERGWPLCESES